MSFSKNHCQPGMRVLTKSQVMIWLRANTKSRRDALDIVEKIYPRRQQIDAIAWLKKRLSSKAVKSQQIFAEGEHHELSKTTLYRAARALHVKTIRKGYGKQKRAYWRMP